MAKISLWQDTQGHDYTYTDRISREYIDLSGTAVYVHKYVGPIEKEGDSNKSNIADGITSDEKTIEDILLLENRDRKYQPDIYELRGTYTVNDTDFDLSQFGIFLTDDTIFMTFHLNGHVENLGRKLMNGDVLELPHLREYFPLDEEKAALNRFFVVEDASNSAEGYGPRWWPHLWRVRAKIMPASTEYQDILDRATGDGQELESQPPEDDSSLTDTIGDTIIGGGTEELNSDLEELANRDVPHDYLHYDASHIWIYVDPITQEHQLIWWKTGDGVPPNGQQLAGSGETFPDTLVDGDYFLRTDFSEPVLFQKRGSRFYRIEVDQSKLPVTGANQLQDTFINNDNTTTNDDGTEIPEKQALSKVVKARPKDDV